MSKPTEQDWMAWLFLYAVFTIGCIITATFISSTVGDTAKRVPEHLARMYEFKDDFEALLARSQLIIEQEKKNKEEFSQLSQLNIDLLRAMLETKFDQKKMVRHR